MTGDPFTGGNHEEWDKENTLEIGGTVIQPVPDIAGRDIRTPTSDPDCEQD